MSKIKKELNEFLISDKEKFLKDSKEKIEKLFSEYRSLETLNTTKAMSGCLFLSNELGLDEFSCGKMKYIPRKRMKIKVQKLFDYFDLSLKILQKNSLFLEFIRIFKEQYSLIETKLFYFEYQHLYSTSHFTEAVWELKRLERIYSDKNISYRRINSNIFYFWKLVTIKIIYDFFPKTAKLVKFAEKELKYIIEVMTDLFIAGIKTIIFKENGFHFYDNLKLFNIEPESALHCETGPFAANIFGLEIYFISNNEVSKKVVMEPTKIVMDDLENIYNQEALRRIIQRMDVEYFVKNSNGKVISTVQKKEGLYRLYEFTRRNEIRIRIVSVFCPSTGDQYFLRVPPNINDVEEAVAWTFGLEKDEYKPIAET